jgi:photosystem II stability/assembly factor-like uncharacterized protein
MSVRVVLLAAGLSGLAMVGCKKSPPSGGGGGGGGGWLVGTNGEMAEVNGDGQLGAGYHLDSTTNLNGIACRYAGEAWVVGDAGTVLYTNDAGTTWSAQAVPTNADLRALATQDSGPVYLAGNGTFLTTSDTGAHWTQLAESANFTSLAAAQAGSTVLAVSDDGGVWSFTNSALTRIATVPGATAVALSPDGNTAVIAGNGLALSTNAGQTWQNILVDAQLEDVDVVDDDGTAVAVGQQGAIVQLANAEASLQHVGTADLHTLHLADSGDALDVGFAGGDNGEVLVSDDDGATWKLGPNLGNHTVLGIDQIGFGHR